MITRVVFNQKGGVGKSSITVNLAAISAHNGYRTLLIDLDPQCNSSQYLLGEDATFGGEKPALTPNIENFYEETLSSSSSKGKGKSLFGSAIGNILKNDNVSISKSVHKTNFERLDVLPASPTLDRLKHDLETKHKIYKLRDAIAKLTHDYDRIFIDTPPAFNFFTLSALISANSVIIPFDCDVFSKRALTTLLQNIMETRDDHNEDLSVEGIVVNQFDARAKLPQQAVQELIEDGLPVFESKISSSVIMKKSHQENLPLIHLQADHKLTQQYQSLFEELEG